MKITTLEEVRAALADEGYSEDLVADGAQLRVVSSGALHRPEDLRLARVVRFGRISTAEEEALVFALNTSDEDPLGTYAPVAQPELSEADAALIDVLDHDALPTVEGHDGHDHIAAVFDSRPDAQAAVDELRDVGIDDKRLGLALREGSERAFERNAEVETMTHAGAGTAAGAAVGFLAGASVAALALVPGGLIGLGGILAAGGGASLGGAMLGGYIGVGSGNRAFDERAELVNLPLEPGQTLITVCSHGEPGAVGEIIERHGGHLLRRASEG